MRSKPLIPHEWPAHTRTLPPQFPHNDGAVPAHFSADQIEAVEEDTILLQYATVLISYDNRS